MRTVSRLFAVLGCLGLAVAASSCAWFDEVRPTSAGALIEWHPADATDAYQREGEPPSTTVALRVPPLPKVKPRPPVPVRGETPAVETATVMGLSEQEVEILLGPPHHATTAPPARIRDYEDSGCRLRLYLYVDLKTELYRVLHLETSPVAQDAHETGRCLTRLALRTSYSREP